MGREEGAKLNYSSLEVLPNAHYMLLVYSIACNFGNKLKPITLFLVSCYSKAHLCISVHL